MRQRRKCDELVACGRVVKCRHLHDKACFSRSHLVPIGDPIPTEGAKLRVHYCQAVFLRWIQCLFAKTLIAECLGSLMEDFPLTSPCQFSQNTRS